MIGRVPHRDWHRLTGRHYTYVHSAEMDELLGDDLIPLWVGSRFEPAHGSAMTLNSCLLIVLL